MKRYLAQFHRTAAVLAFGVAFCLPSAASATVTQRDVLIKGPDKGATVYYLAQDGKRYVFPNEKMYKSWFSDFSGIVSVSTSDLWTFPLGGNVTYRPGVRMVKITTDPKVYAVGKGGVLRWVTSEAVATSMYGTDWNRKIDDIPDSFFVNYLIGTPIYTTSDFDPYSVSESARTINADRGIAVSSNPRRSDTSPSTGNIVSAVATITSFNIPSITGALGFINENDRTIRVSVPYGTSRTALFPRIGYNGVSISPASDTRQDFTNAVTYRVTASDGTVRNYVVRVEVEPQSSRKSITRFEFVNLAGSRGDIDDDARTIKVEVPEGTSLRSLTPVIEHDGVSMTPSSGTARDFRSGVTYKVTAEDGSSRTYTVTVTVAPPQDAKGITSFIFTNLAEGTVRESNHTIAVTVPNGTNVSSLRPTIEHTGTSVSPSSGSSRDFRNPVTYTVTARDGSKQAYVVTVSISPYSAAKRITSFRFADLDASGSIDQGDHTIDVTVPYGTNVRLLVPTIVHEGASISPASGTARSFSSAVTYTVTAEDGTAQAYRVTVTVSPYSSAKRITSFKFNNLTGATGVINETDRTIAVTVPQGTDRSGLVPTVTYEGASISPASGVAKNFTSPVTYRVTAEDGTSRTYTVTVTVAP